MGELSFFPHEQVRSEQGRFITDVYEAISSGKSLVAHAPTGLGKTSAALAPALSYAIQKGKTIFFLTSRHTQHIIAVETLMQIKERHNAKFSIVDIVGKKHMCAQEGVESLPGRQFHEFCKSLREGGNCNFFTNMKNGLNLSFDAKIVIEEIKKTPLHTEAVVELAKRNSVCPYESASAAAAEAAVVITDYYYLFHPKIRAGFLRKTGKKIEDSIIIVDEAHNLPDRMREMMTQRLSSLSIDRAFREIQKFGTENEQKFIHSVQSSLSRIASGIHEDKLVSKDEFLENLKDYDIDEELVKLEIISEQVRQIQRISSIGAVTEFIMSWKRGKDSGYCRIASRKKGYKSDILSLSYQCLDPALEAGSIISKAHASVLMSGTLSPTFMYKDILGLSNSTEKVYPNPFPPQNKLSLIVTDATTAYSKRSDDQYSKIASICVNAINEIPGNVAVFFPSYSLLADIYRFMHSKVNKDILVETQDMSKIEKQKMITLFKQSYLRGGLLLGVISGNFSEGVDLPGDFLNGVIIVGLPLTQPDLQTKELITYFDKKYAKGWDYGYIYPAFTKAMQCAGRCIRSETDRGVVMFIDERYAWPKYYSCFPVDMKPKATRFYTEAIRDFFARK